MNDTNHQRLYALHPVLLSIPFLSCDHTKNIEWTREGANLSVEPI
jgi:hypothetical protein